MVLEDRLTYNIYRQFKFKIHWFKEDADRKVDFNGSIKFSYFYFEATLECFLCTEQIKNGGHQV